MDTHLRLPDFDSIAEHHSPRFEGKDSLLPTNKDVEYEFFDAFMAALVQS